MARHIDYSDPATPTRADAFAGQGIPGLPDATYVSRGHVVPARLRRCYEAWIAHDEATYGGTEFSEWCREQLR